MSNLIENLKQKYDFIREEDTVLKGYSSNIVLENYFFEIEETDVIEPLRIILNQCHENNKPKYNYFKVSLVNCGTDDEPQELFWTDNYSKIVNFISSILE